MFSVLVLLNPCGKYESPYSSDSQFKQCMCRFCVSMQNIFCHPHDFLRGGAGGSSGHLYHICNGTAAGSDLHTNNISTHFTRITNTSHKDQVSTHFTWINKYPHTSHQWQTSIHTLHINETIIHTLHINETIIHTLHIEKPVSTHFTPMTSIHTLHINENYSHFTSMTNKYSHTSHQ